MPALRGKDYGKTKMRYPDYIETESGLQYKVIPCDILSFLSSSVLTLVFNSELTNITGPESRKRADTKDRRDSCGKPIISKIFKENKHITI